MTAGLEAPGLARQLLETALGDRYRHVAGVAARAGELAGLLGIDPEPLVSAAWLHDVGYSPVVVDTGFHPLDGARYLDSIGFDQRIVRLVAFHSGARIEAEFRGLQMSLLDEFEQPEPDHLALLTYSDLTTGPRGQRMTFDERIEDIRRRYSPHDVVCRSIDAAESELRRTVQEVEGRLRRAQSQ